MESELNVEKHVVVRMYGGLVQTLGADDIFVDRSNKGRLCVFDEHGMRTPVAIMDNSGDCEDDAWGQA